MDRELYALDLDTLQALYQEESNRLNEELLAGAAWDSLQERKIKVTELAITIHKRKHPQYFNPAESGSPRQDKDREDNPR